MPSQRELLCLGGSGISCNALPVGEAVVLGAVVQLLSLQDHICSNATTRRGRVPTAFSFWTHQQMLPNFLTT